MLASDRPVAVERDTLALFSTSLGFQLRRPTILLTPCYMVVFEDTVETPSTQKLQSALEKGSDEDKLDTLHKIIVATIMVTVTLALLCPYIICHTRGSNSQPHYDNNHYQTTTLLILYDAPGLDSRTALWLSASCLPHDRSFTMHIAQPRI